MGQSVHIGIHVSRPAELAYSYVADPAHLPCWAAGVDAATEVRFVPPNEHLVLDHDVTLPDGSVTRNPMRVLPDGDGCEVVFTLRRGTGTSDEAFDADADAVRSDLQTLKELLEHYSPVEDCIAGFPPEAAVVLEEVERVAARHVEQRHADRGQPPTTPDGP